MLRILVVSQVFWPENFCVNELAVGLRERGHDVTVLTGVPNYPQGSVFADYAAAPARFAMLDGCRIVRVPVMVRGRGGLRRIANYLSFALSASLWGAWRLRGEAFDVIFVFQVSPVTVGLPAVWLRWLKNAPVLFWIQDLWPETLSAVGALRASWSLGWVGSLVSFIYRRCDHILVQSEQFITPVRARAPLGASISYLPNWVRLGGCGVGGAGDVGGAGEVGEGAPCPRITLAAAPGTFRILFTGNLGEAQDLPAVLDAVVSLRGRALVHWYLVGDGSRKAWLRAELGRRGLEDCVSLLGPFPLEAMPGLYAQADALLVSLCPAALFGMTVPSKLQSYLAAGRPILGMLDGEGAAVIRRAAAGLTCRAGDSEGLAGAVMQLVGTSAAVRACMGRAGQEYAQANFDRVRLLSRLEQWMKDACRAG